MQLILREDRDGQGKALVDLLKAHGYRVLNETWENDGLQCRLFAPMEDVLRYEDICLHPLCFTITCGKNEQHVSRREMEILRCFIKSGGAVVEKGELFTKVWETARAADISNVEVYMSGLRRKLRLLGSVVTIVSVRGVGYRMMAKRI